MNKLLILGSVFMLSVFNCGSSRQAIQPQTEIYQTKWLLKKIDPGRGMEEVNTRAFIRFDKEKKSAGGNGSCNSFGSNFSLEGSAIHFSNIFSTKMFCEGVQATEDRFFKLLEQADQYEVKGDILELRKKDKTLLVFKAG